MERSINVHAAATNSRVLGKNHILVQEPNRNGNLSERAAKLLNLFDSIENIFNIHKHHCVFCVAKLTCRGHALHCGQVLDFLIKLFGTFIGGFSEIADEIVTIGDCANKAADFLGIIFKCFIGDFSEIAEYVEGIFHQYIFVHKITPLI